MERGTSPKRAPGGKGRGKFTPRIGIEKRVIAADTPAGSRFKGYESFLVQDLFLRVGDPLLAGAVGDAGGPDNPGAAAGRGGGAFRRGTTTFLADAASPGSGDGGAADGAVAGLWGGDFEAAGVRLLIERQEGFKPSRKGNCRCP